MSCPACGAKTAQVREEHFAPVEFVGYKCGHCGYLYTKDKKWG